MDFKNCLTKEYIQNLGPEGDEILMAKILAMASGYNSLDKISILKTNKNNLAKVVDIINIMLDKYGFIGLELNRRVKGALPKYNIFGEEIATLPGYGASYRAESSRSKYNKANNKSDRRDKNEYEIASIQILFKFDKVYILSYPLGLKLFYEEKNILKALTYGTKLMSDSDIIELYYRL